MNFKTALAVLTNYRTALAVLGAAIVFYAFRASPHLGGIASKPAASVVSQSAGGSVSAGGSISVPGPIVPLAIAPSAHSVHYFRNLNTGATLVNGVIAGVTSPETYVNIVNPGTNGAAVNSSTTGVGALCALIYVTDTNGLLQECCGCLVQPDQMLEVGVQALLLTNPIDREVMHNGTISIISAPPTGTPKSANDNTVCDPADPNVNPTPELLAWTTHTRAYSALSAGQAYPGSAATAATLGVTETPFEFAPLSAGKLSTFTTVCASIDVQGVTSGLCSCPVAPPI